MGTAVAIAPEYEIASTLSGVDGVEGVYISTTDGILNVFSVIADDDEDLYDRIYAREMSLISEFPQVRFDFNVIPRRGRPVEDIVGAATPIAQRASSWPTPAII